MERSEEEKSGEDRSKEEKGEEERSEEEKSEEERSEEEESEEVKQNQIQRKGEGKSCAGILYHYASAIKSNGRNLCFGYRRSIPLDWTLEIPSVDDGVKGCRTVCFGHSRYRIRDESSPDNEHDEVEIPDCRGLQFIGRYYDEDTDKRKHGADTEEDFLSRFQRNAYVVAKGVAHNMSTVGTYIKDILSGKGPK